MSLVFWLGYLLAVSLTVLGFVANLEEKRTPLQVFLTGMGIILFLFCTGHAVLEMFKNFKIQ